MSIEPRPPPRQLVAKLRRVLGGGAGWRGVFLQLLFVVVLAWIGYEIVDNVRSNLASQRIAAGFGFLTNNAGFDVNQTLIPYSGSDSYARVFVVGMYLNGKFVGGEQKFYQQGEFRGVHQRRTAPANRHFAPRCAESLTLVGTADDAAIDGGKPHFADGFGQFGLVRKQRRKRARAPDPRHEDWSDTAGRGFHGLDGYLGAGEEFFQAAQAFIDAFDRRGV